MKTILLFVVAASAVVAAGFFLRTSGPSTTVVEQAAANSGEQHVPDRRAAGDSTRPVLPRAGADPIPPVPLSISQGFASATDYLEFGNSILERAKDGDAAAQYYLFAVLEYCDESYRAFFRGAHGRTRTLDEALNRVSTRPQESVDEVRTAYARCSRIFDGGSQPLGTAGTWLKLATENGQPLALATTAKALLLNPVRNAAKTDETVPGEGSMDARAMLARALRSKDPEVMWKIGEIQPLLEGNDTERMLDQWSWWLAACQRGYDCEHSRWIEYFCRFDQLCVQGESALDFIRRSTQLDFPEIESRAKEINASIDSESWGALGFEPAS